MDAKLKKLIEEIHNSDPDKGCVRVPVLLWHRIHEELMKCDGKIYTIWGWL